MSAKVFESKLRYFLLEMPDAISRVGGVKIFGRTIKSLLFTTDIALIKNTDADAILAMYPFATHPSVNSTILKASNIPVFCGIGGNMPVGRLVDVAVTAEFMGAMGLVVDAGMDNVSISKIKNAVDIPIIATVISKNQDIESKIECGADIFNVSGAAQTCDIIEKIKNKYPYVPIIATGGPTDESIIQTIECGADAISFTPPTNAEIFRKQMQIFRDNYK